MSNDGGTQPNTMHITCKRYKELIVGLRTMSELDQKLAAAQIRQHQKLCSRHDREAGIDRLTNALRNP